jgi:hypothetical protein
MPTVLVISKIERNKVAKVLSTRASQVFDVVSFLPGQGSLVIWVTSDYYFN